MMRGLFHSCFRLLVLVASLLVTTTHGSADDLQRPRGEPVLIVSGKIGPATEVAFDIASLQSLPAVSFRTRTIWSEGDNLYTGVRLLDLLTHLGAIGKTVHAVALNDYAVDIPFSDATSDGPIVAYAIDGKELPVRSRGPLWIIYPFDSNAAYRSEVIYSRSIWQLYKIEIRD